MKKTNLENKVEESKISDLHLAKLQESNMLLNQIQNKASELYQLEFDLKMKKALLDSDNEKMLSERIKLLNELKNTYGDDVKIDFQTGLIHKDK